MLTAVGFLTSAVTGLVLYIEPHGRIAYWTNWRLLGLGKDQWDGIHIISSAVFVVAGGFHLVYNWRPFLSYMRAKVETGLRLRRELGIAVAALLLIVISGIFHLPPLGWLLDANEAIKTSWVDDLSDNPPFGHAELKSLGFVTRYLGLDPAVALDVLRREGIEDVGLRDTLEEIAGRHGLPPGEIYRILKQASPATPGGEFTPLGPARPGRMQGTGTGRGRLGGGGGGRGGGRGGLF